MRRGVHHPENRIGNVLRLDRLGTCVGGVITRLVTAEAHQGELALTQARLDIGHAHAGALQVAAQVQRELLHERLGTAIHMAARVRVVTGDGTQVDDPGTAAMGNQARQQQVSGGQQALDVGIDHGFPIVEVALGRRVGAHGQAGVVDQAAQRGERRRQVGDGLLHAFAVAHIHHQAMHFGLLGKLFDQGVQALGTTTGEHQFPAGLGKATGTGFAET